MSAVASSSDRRRVLGPYSRVLRRGAIRDSIDGRSIQGRLIRDMEAQLVAHVGGKPTIVQRLLIDRLIRIRLQLDALDVKLANGWTDHDSRTYGGLLNAFRLTAREIGIEAAPEPTKTLPELMAELRASKPEDRAARATAKVDGQ